MHAPPAPKGVAERNGEHGSHWRKPDAGRIQQNGAHPQRQQQLKKGHRQRPSRTGCAIHQVDRRHQQERHRDLPGKSERNDTISTQQHIGHVGQDLHARHGATRTRARGRRIAFPQTGRRCPHQNIFPGKQLFQLRLTGTEYVHIGKETGSRRKGYQEHLIPHPSGRRPPSGDPVANGGRSFRRWPIHIQQRQGQIRPPWRPDTGPEIAASHLAVRIQLHIDVSQRSGTAGKDLQRPGFLQQTIDLGGLRHHRKHHPATLFQYPRQLGISGGIHPVGLRQDQIQGHRFHSCPVQPLYEPGVQRPRPGPLPQLRETSLVDGDNHHITGRGTLYHLKDVVVHQIVQIRQPARKKEPYGDDDGAERQGKVLPDGYHPVPVLVLHSRNTRPAVPRKKRGIRFSSGGTISRGRLYSPG